MTVAKAPDAAHPFQPSAADSPVQPAPAAPPDWNNSAIAYSTRLIVQALGRVESALLGLAGDNRVGWHDVRVIREHTDTLLARTPYRPLQPVEPHSNGAPPDGQSV
jgi:hypothetical protein